METIAAISVIMGGISSVIIAIDLIRNRQSMTIMNPVWILTGLWGGPIALVAYFWFGRHKGEIPKARMESNKKMEGMPGMVAMDMEQDQSSAKGEVKGVDNMPDMKDMPGMKMEGMPGMVAMDMGQDQSSAKGEMKGMGNMSGMKDMKMAKRPHWQSVTLSTLHCGAGCTLADLIGEWFLYFVAITILGSTLLGSVVVDYILALAIGVYFQYAAIGSMSCGNIKRTTIVKQAFRADVLSLTAWQVGMYGFMALAIFVIFKGQAIEKTSWIFWFMMQIAMLAGFLAAFPMNILLIKLGIKKAM